jgi:chemotaxis protein MotB
MAIKKKPAVHGGDEWKIAYIDLLTNVLIFFIMAFSLSIADVGRLKMFSEYFTGKAAPKSAGTIPQTGRVPIDQPGGLVPRSSIIPAFEELKKLSQIPGVQVSQKKEGVYLTLADKLLYDVGRADLKHDALPIMDRVAEILKTTSFDLRVEGHTDNVPIHTFQFPSNWELSTTRAVSVVRYLVEVKKIPPARLSAVGYGEFKPVASNETPEGRQSNRRVEMVLIGAKL